MALPKKKGHDLPGDRLMTIRHLATYLRVNERTVLKLVQDGALPGVKVGNQWRFRKAMIDTWLDDQMLGITPRYVQPLASASPRRLMTLDRCFDETHILPELRAETKLSVVVELSAHAEQLGLIRDATWFVGALVQRENVLPSAMGNGVAFLHTLHRSPEQVIRPFMVLGRSIAGVDFDALDGERTHLFFVLGLRYDELHLPWLSKLVRMLAQPDVVPALLQASGSAEIHRRLAEAESTLQSAAVELG